MARSDASMAILLESSLPIFAPSRFTGRRLSPIACPSVETGEETRACSDRKDMQATARGPADSGQWVAHPGMDVQAIHKSAALVRGRV